MKLSVLVPAYNEERWIGATLTALHKALPGAELVVVDDGSSDGTAAVARELATVVSTDSNVGKAGALQFGLPHCSGHVIALVDADMGPGAQFVSQLLPWVVTGGWDMAIALFASSTGGGLGLVRGLARWGIFCCTGRLLVAPLSGQRLARRDLLEHCLPTGGRFGLETELTLRALRRGYRVVEVPTGFVHRGDGWTLRGAAHRGRQLWDVAGALWRGGRA